MSSLGSAVLWNLWVLHLGLQTTPICYYCHTEVSFVEHNNAVDIMNHFLRIQTILDWTHVDQFEYLRHGQRVPHLFIIFVFLLSSSWPEIAVNKQFVSNSRVIMWWHCTRIILTIMKFKFSLGSLETILISRVLISEESNEMNTVFYESRRK